MATNNHCPFDITPYTQSQVITTPSIFNLNYTNQDFWSMKSRLVDFVKQKFPNDFSDFVESSLAIMLIENWAFIADTLSFKMDQIANEIFIDTVTELENAFRLAKLVGFQPQPPIASRCLFTATLNNALNSDLTVPTPYDIAITSGGSPIRYELFAADSENNPIFDQDIVIPAGSLVNASIVGLEGKTTTANTAGNGAANQTFALTNIPVIYDSIRVYVDGVQWQYVDYFTESQPRREFRVEYDSSYQAFVIFGNNRAGLIPSNGSNIRFVYRQGGGTIGNVVSGSVSAQGLFNVPNIPFGISVSFRNYTKGEFGYNGDTIDDIRAKLPAWSRAQNRAVTGLDYKTLADQFATPYQGQTGKSTAVLRNYGCSGNIVDLYILVKDGVSGLAVASDEFKNSLTNHMNQVKMFSDFLCIRDGQVIMVDTTVDVVMDRLYRKFEDEFMVKIQRRLDAFFALSNWEYGETLREVDVTKVLSDLKEINSIDLNFSTNDPNNGGNVVTSRFFEIIRPDTTVINFTYE